MTFTTPSTERAREKTFLGYLNAACQLQSLQMSPDEELFFAKLPE